MSEFSCDVILPYHPATVDWVSASIESILNQQNASCIIHVVADGVSAEQSSKLSADFADAPHIHFYRNNEPIGPYRSLHTVFPFLRSDHIAIQDSDDIALPHRIWHSMTELKKRNADIYGGAMENFVDWKSKNSLAVADFMNNHGRIECSGHVDHYCPSGGIINATMLMKKSSFETLNGFADWFCNADVEFVERAQRAGMKVVCDKCVVILRRLHAKSLCNNDEYGFQSEKRNILRRELAKRFEEFIDGFDPKKYGSLH